MLHCSAVKVPSVHLGQWLRHFSSDLFCSHGKNHSNFSYFLAGPNYCIFSYEKGSEYRPCTGSGSNILKEKQKTKKSLSFITFFPCKIQFCRSENEVYQGFQFSSPWQERCAFSGILSCHWVLTRWF